MRSTGLNMATVLLGALLAGTSVIATQQVRPEVVLRAAIELETTKGDTKGAIEAYKQLGQGDNKAVAATALWRLAELYRKLNDPQAQAVYERLARDFTGQPEATLAGKVLASLAAERQSTGGLSERTILRPGMARGLWDWSAVSPDGRFLSTIDDSTGNLAIVELSTLTSRNLTRSKGWDEGNSYASVWSGDGRQVAYAWDATNRSDFDLRVIGIDGTGDRSVLLAERGIVTPLAWSPDRLAILVSLRNVTMGVGEQHCELALVPAAGGPRRTIRTFTGRDVERAAFSPDGQFIAFQQVPDRGDPARDVLVTRADGTGDVRPLVSGATDDTLLAWLPDGRLLYTSDPAGSPAAFALTVRQGIPSGLPSLVKSSIPERTEPLGVTRDGALFLVASSGGMDVFLATINPTTGVAATGPQPVGHRPAGMRRGYASWAPDGDRLAYFATAAGRVPSLAVHTVSSGDVRLFPLPARNLERPAWHPSGQEVMIEGLDLTDRQGLFRVDVSTGRLSPLLQQTDLFSVYGQYAQDGNAIVYGRYGRADPAGGIWRRQLADGSEDKIYSHPGIGSSKLSPDGRFLAVYSMRPIPGQSNASPNSRFLVVSPTSGGNAKVIAEIPTPSVNHIAWSHDGLHLYFNTTSPNRIWRVPAAGGAPVDTGISLSLVKHMSANPRTGQLAITAGNPTAEVVVWERVK